ncbi:MAG: extracellular solute-binding protein [Lachnospiraceae bacterium]|nr:extracellular solute-binding protein [Lachnospiraceae bacterium]
MKKNVLKRVLPVMMMTSAALGMTACGSQSQTAAAPAAASADATTAAATETTTAAIAEAATTAATSAAAETKAPVQTKPLVVYLNDFDAVIPDLFKKATGYDVEVVVGNGAETMSRIEAEKSNPQWDVVWIDSMYDVYNLSKDDCLVTGWEPANAANLTDFSKALIPDNKCMAPTDIHAAGVIVYRNDVYTEADAPKTYAELADEKYKDQVGMADPGVAAPAYPLAAYFMDDLGLDAGKEYFSKMFDLGLKVYPKNPQVVAALASGEISIAILQESNAYDMVSSGEPISIIWPEAGAPGSTRVAAISKSTQQEDIAKIFVNFLLDPETQQQLVNTGDEGYFEPSVNGVTLKAERAANAKLAVADEEFGAENEADIKAWFADMSAQ